MKMYEATVRDMKTLKEEKKRIGANSPEEARRKLQELYGPRAVPFMPHQVPF
jgi:hypothetical protein